MTEVAQIERSEIGHARTKRGGLRRRISLLAVSLLVVSLGSVMLGVQPARASAYTCAFGASITIFHFPTIPTVEFCNGVNGSGTYVDNTYGSFLTPGVICNYSITSEFFNSSSQWYRTFSSGTHWGCSFPGWGSETMRIYERFYAQRGFVCNTLRENGTRVTSSCFSIY